MPSGIIGVVHSSHDVTVRLLTPLVPIPAPAFAEEPELSAGSGRTGLWPQLLLQEPAISDGSSPALAVEIFGCLHRDGDADASLLTAVLLLTSSRWPRRTQVLIDGIIGSGLLAVEDLDDLAIAVNRADRLRLLVPAVWFDGSAPDSGPDGEVLDETEANEDRGQDGPSHSAVVADADANLLPVPALYAPGRMVPVALRRWAVAHLLRRSARAFTPLRTRVRELSSAQAAAAMAGLLDASDVLTERHVAELQAEGLVWPHKLVRVRALEMCAAAGEWEAVAATAAADGDATVRTFAAKLLAARTGAGTGSESASQSGLF